VAAHPGRFGSEDLYGLAEEVTQRLNTDAAGFLKARAADGSLAALQPAIDSALLNSASGQRGAVWEWLAAQPDSDTAQALKLEVLRTAGYQDPDLALRLAVDVPNTPAGDAQIAELARALFNGGQELHRFDKLYAEAPERLRATLVKDAFDLLASRNNSYLDTERWTARLSLVPETARTKAAASLAAAWGERNPEEALAWAQTLASGDARNGANAAIVSAWAEKDAYSATEWVSTLPAGAARDQSVKSLVLAVAAQFPREAWGWACSIGDTVERDQAAAAAVKAMAVRDPTTARQWLESELLSTETRKQLQSNLK
jgi:hypothetical protein